jgi:hypothetical protein
MRSLLIVESSASLDPPFTGAVALLVDGVGEDGGSDAGGGVAAPPPPPPESQPVSTANGTTNGMMSAKRRTKTRPIMDVPSKV